MADIFIDKQNKGTSYVKSWQQTVYDEQQEMCNYFADVDWDRYEEDELNVLKDKINLLLFGSADQLQDEEESQEKKPEAENESIKKENQEREILVNEICDSIVKYGKRQLIKDNENETDIPNKTNVLLFGSEDQLREEEEDKSIKNEKREGTILVNECCDTVVKEGKHQLINDSENETHTPNKKSVYMVYIFVFWKDTKGNIGCWPVFRVPNDNTGKTASFIDSSKRVYSDWKDFLENNQLPPCEYCYPRNGKYYRINGRVAVDFGISPARGPYAKVLNNLDITSSAVSVAATVVTVASLTTLPIAAPILVGATWAGSAVSGYSLFRAFNFLRDRKIHKQNIGFGHRETRGCYISIIASAVGFGASAASSATVRAVQNGRVLGKVTAGAVNAINGSALVINGVGMINSLQQLVEKHKEQQLTKLDVVQFSASLLLFCHSTVNFKTARTIIENTRNDCINDFRNGLRSNRHRKVYDKLVRNTVKVNGNTDGKALVIRSMQKIDNVDDFFAGMVRTDKQFRYVKNKAVFAGNGNIKIDGKTTVDPSLFCYMNKNDRVNFLRAAQKYAKNKISDAKFKSISDYLFKDISNSPKLSAMFAGETSNNPFKNPNLMNKFPHVIALLSVAQKIELSHVLEDFPEQYQNIILQLLNVLFTLWNGEYIDIAYLVCDYVKYILFLVVEKHKKYVLEVLQDWIHTFPAEEMGDTKFCLVLLEEFLLHPETLLCILQNVKSFYCVLTDSSPLFYNDRQVSYLELVSIASILMKTEKLQWDEIIECTQRMFHAVGFKKVSSLIAIAKQLCSYIEKAVIDMQERHDENRKIVDDDNDDIDSSMNSPTNNNLKRYFTKAIESLKDEEIYDSLQKRIREDAINLQ